MLDCDASTLKVVDGIIAGSIEQRVAENDMSSRDAWRCAIDAASTARRHSAERRPIDDVGINTVEQKKNAQNDSPANSCLNKETIIQGVCLSDTCRNPRTPLIGAVAGPLFPTHNSVCCGRLRLLSPVSPLPFSRPCPCASRAGPVC
jgi:hypothetical protein